MNWKPIEEAPRDGNRIICYAPGWEDWEVRAWKSNPRFKPPKEYWGCPREWDDYDMIDNQPSMWWPVVLPEKK